MDLSGRSLLIVIQVRSMGTRYQKEVGPASTSTSTGTGTVLVWVQALAGCRPRACYGQALAEVGPVLDLHDVQVPVPVGPY